MNATLRLQTEYITSITNCKKILFASVPFDSHVNPLTGLAVHLKTLGYDVRWYTSAAYASQISKLNIHHYPFVKAIDIRADNIDQVLPERRKQKSRLAKLNFDLVNVFALRAFEYYSDLLEIHKNFRFDCVVADSAFTGLPFVKEKMNIPVVAVGVHPLMQPSRDVPPAGLGITPSYSLAGSMKQSMLHWIANKMLFRKANRALEALCAKHQLAFPGGNVFNFVSSSANLFLQSGTPGFEYKRSDLGDRVRFIGALLPYSEPVIHTPWFDERLNKYQQVIVLTKGSAEKDINELLVPTLEAFKDTNVLVVATTGGRKTQSLKKRYPQANIIIEDFIPFADILPYADAFVTDGGYAGVLMSIQHGVPLVVAGKDGSKNEVNARVGYFNLGINMRDESPTPNQMRRAVVEALNNVHFKTNVNRLSREFSRYHPEEICSSLIYTLLHPKQMPAQEPGFSHN